MLGLEAFGLDQVIFDMSGVIFSVPSYVECWYPARVVNVNPLRGTICILAQATGEQECNILNIGCFAELNISSNFNSFFRVFPVFNYSGYEDPAEICFSCFTNMPNNKLNAIDQCVHSLSSLEVLSVAIYNLNIYTWIPIGPVTINTLDFSNCYENNVVTVTYDYLTSALTIHGKPTYMCSALTRAQLLKIALYMEVNSTAQFLFTNFDLAQFSFNMPEIQSICIFPCREAIFAVTRRAGIDGVFTLDFKNSIYGGAMIFPVQKVFSDRGHACFINFLTTIAPYYIGTSIELLQTEDCSNIRVPDDQLVEIQVVIFNKNYSSTIPIFQWTSYQEFKLLTQLSFIYTICHDAPRFTLICNILTQLISSNNIITSEVILTFPNYTTGGTREDLVLRYPVPNTKLGAWGFINAYVASDHISFVSQKLLQLPVDSNAEDTSMSEAILLVNVYLQSKSLNNLTRIISLKVPVTDLSPSNFKFYCSDPTNFLASACIEWLARLRKDEGSYTMLLTFTPDYDNDIDSIYLVTLISVSPVLNDLLWQLLLLGLAVCVCITVELVLLLCCEKDKEKTDPNGARNR